MTIEIEMETSELSFADLLVGEAFKAVNAGDDVFLKVASNDFLHRSGREANSVSLTRTPAIYVTNQSQKVTRVTLKCKVMV